MGDDADDLVRRHGGAGADRADAADHAAVAGGGRHRRHVRPAHRRPRRIVARPCRRGDALRSRPFQCHHAQQPAAVLLHDRQRHGAVRPGLAGLGQRAGAGRHLACGGGAERHQLQHRAQLRAGAGRHHRGGGGRRRGLRLQRAVVHPPSHRAVSLAAHARAVAAAARAAAPGRRLRRALHRPLAIDPHRAVPHAGHRHRGRFGAGAAAAGGARHPSRQRADLRHHAGMFRHGRRARGRQHLNTCALVSPANTRCGCARWRWASPSACWRSAAGRC